MFLPSIPGLGGDILLLIPVSPVSTFDDTKVPAFGDPRAPAANLFRPLGDLSAPKFFMLLIDPFGCVSLLVSLPY